MHRYLTLLFLVATALAAVAQPTIDGNFDGTATWGDPVSTADNNPGWAGADLADLYVTYDATYVYFGVTLNSAADWMSWGIAINTSSCSAGTQEVWGYPIAYDYEEQPDAVIKGHFGQGSSPYAELRVWSGSSYEQLNNDGQQAGLAVVDYAGDESGMIEVRIEKELLGDPATVDLQVYISGDVGTDHATFDALPDDEIAADWADATVLQNYAKDVAFGGSDAVTIAPSLPDDTDQIILTFDATGSALDGISNIYLHAGASTTATNPRAFDQVIGNWGQDDGVGQMTNTGGNNWQITLPNLRNYFQLDTTENAFGLNFLFRSADGQLLVDNGGCNYYKETDPGAYFTIVSPLLDPALVPVSEALVSIFAASTTPLSWALDKVDELGNAISTEATASAVDTFLYSIVQSTAMEQHYRVTANFTGGSKSKYFTIVSYNPVSETPRPTWTLPGINYHDNDPTKATLVLHAPTHTRYYQHPQGQSPLQTGSNETAAYDVVYVVGDFNNWTPSEDYKMARDRDGWDQATMTDTDNDGDRGDYFWLELSNLDPDSSYVFQYLIDGALQVADPYTNQVVDQDDQYISADRYAALPPYPTGAQGRASLLKTGVQDYTWTAPPFAKPTDNNLNIYELHFRDFTAEGTYLAAVQRLDYLKALGVNAIHVMPVSEFEGNSSWGYNPNFYFAADKYYGTPSDLKKFVDECHAREIQVFNDLVLNHAFYSNVMARMYWNSVANRPANDNPWFNPEHKMVAEPAGWWGADWNHESEHTQRLMDRILDFWLQEFRFDGFRFDFTKGIGQTAQDPNDPWASSYDQNRIDLLMRLVNGMKSRNPGSVAIFEHLANSSEDAVLGNAGILMWSGTGQHGKIKEVNLGYNGADLYTTGIYTAQGFTFANWMSYMESHDEERQGYEVSSFGNAIVDTEDVVDRLKIGAVFNLLFPGPRMIWQFEEVGYDVSINFNGRTGEKPIKWEYFHDNHRRELWRLMSMIFYLRDNYTLYNTTPDYGNIGSAAGVNEPRRMELHDGNGNYVIAIANLDPINNQTVTPGYDVTGTWYKYNGDPAVDGTIVTVSNTNATYTLQPSESLLLTNFDLAWTDACEQPGACCVEKVFTWAGGVGDWNVASNWDQNDIPEPCDLVIVPASGDVTIAAGAFGYAYKVITATGANLQILGTLEVTRR